MKIYIIIVPFLFLLTSLTAQENTVLPDGYQEDSKEYPDIAIAYATIKKVDCDDDKTLSYTRQVFYPGKSATEAHECYKAWAAQHADSDAMRDSIKTQFQCDLCDDGERCEASVGDYTISKVSSGLGGGNPVWIRIKVKYKAICAKCPEDKVASRSLTKMASFFPNPASNYLNINLAVTSKSDKVNLRLVDISGRVIINVTDNLQDGVLYSGIDVSSLVPGMYVLQASTDGKVIHTEKIQVTK